MFKDVCTHMDDSVVGTGLQEELIPEEPHYSSCSYGGIVMFPQHERCSEDGRWELNIDLLIKMAQHRKFNQLQSMMLHS